MSAERAQLCWSAKDTEIDLHPLLRTIAEEYPLSEEGEGSKIHFKRLDAADALQVKYRPDGFWIEYGSRMAAARGIGYALAGIEANEKLNFKTFGILLDCSRTAIVTVEHFKRWLRRLALMGYNMAMLYTKDAYQLPGETYFGYMRGAYSIEEIREIDAYAAKLGVEMVASIQALGHLEPVLRWAAYREIKDTDNVILVDEEKSYVLLEKMLKFWSDALGTRRIHLGMDETHDLGRGRFMDIFGYERPFDIYNRHLGRVCRLCEKFELKPMIWSDMYFRLGNKNQDYYDPKTIVPEDVKAAIDKNAELVYWDYYHRDEAFYADYIEKHRKLGKEPLMASGIWTWGRMWYDHEQTMGTVKPCIDACRKAGLGEIIFTMWGDDGSYCEFDSAFAGMAWAADYAFNPKDDEERIGKLFHAIFNTSYKLQIEAADLEMSVSTNEGKTRILPAAVLWDDPLMGIIWHEYLHFDKEIWPRAAASLRKTREQMTASRSDTNAGHIDHAWNICNVLIKKIEFRIALLNAYEKENRTELAALKSSAIPELLEAIQGLNASFRKQWFRSYKPYGLEVMQIKLAGLCERYRELARRIDEYLDGRIPSLGELELKPETRGFVDSRYRMIATGGWFI
ncbi:MAG: hypothetical protein A2X49_13825 [Lentisphaerae bacterium GWF2_52_8]|nr:MAG: hypothetical protein A2X49_13825 [Lentisphaerae bacterium GWF2_52_8]